jgi:hypothetical protein
LCLTVNPTAVNIIIGLIVNECAADVKLIATECAADVKCKIYQAINVKG